VKSESFFSSAESGQPRGLSLSKPLATVALLLYADVLTSPSCPPRCKLLSLVWQRRILQLQVTAVISAVKLLLHWSSLPTLFKKTFRNHGTTVDFHQLYALTGNQQYCIEARKVISFSTIMILDNSHDKYKLIIYG